jgi:imidazole glycerol-phosphate synthase subunit HisH
VSGGVDVAIIDSGGANLASLQFALDRLGARSLVSSDAAVIAAAPRVLLPGVGAAADAMRRLRATGLDRLIPQLQAPLLGICLGMQLLFEHSTEGDTACLGRAARPGRAPATAAPHLPVPHMGWNTLEQIGDDPLLQGIEPAELPLFRTQLRRRGRRQHAGDGALWSCAGRGGAPGEFSWRAVSSGTLGRRRRAHSAQFSGAIAGARMLLIPSIDLRGGHCVRLLKGDFAAETRYQARGAGPAVALSAARGSWLHVVDLDAARDGTLGNRDLIHQLAAQRAVGLQVGGGLRDRAAIDDLFMHGVARAVIGSAAVEQPGQVADWMHSFGPERICLAFDVRLDAQRAYRACRRTAGSIGPRCRCGTRSRHFPMTD